MNSFGLTYAFLLCGPKRIDSWQINAVVALWVNSAMNLSAELAVPAVLAVLAVWTDAVECNLAFYYSVTHCLPR